MSTTGKEYTPLSELFVISEPPPSLAEKAVIGTIVCALTAVVLCSALFVTARHVDGADGVLSARMAVVPANGKAIHATR